MSVDFNSSKRPTGIILFIDDNPGEHTLFKSSMKETGVENEVKTFINGEDALNFLTSTQEEIFFIISDINMPKMDGLELKRRIEAVPDIRARSIPFVFHSNQTSPAEIRTAFRLSIQGFIKKGDYHETVKLLKTLFYFWSNCIHPKDVA